MTYQSKLLQDLDKKLARARREEQKLLEATLAETQKRVRDLRLAMRELKNVQTQVRRCRRRLLEDLKLGHGLSKTMAALDADIEKVAKAGDADRETELRKRIKRRDKEAQVRLASLGDRSAKVAEIRKRMAAVYDGLKRLDR